MAEKHNRNAVNSDSVNTILIPDSLCQEFGVGLSWAGSSTFGLYPNNHHPGEAADEMSQHEKSNSEKYKDYVHYTRSDTILFDPIARKLVNESNGYFIFAQKLSEHLGNKDFPFEILKLSRQYRSVIRACLEDFQNAAETCTDNEKKLFYLQNIPIFYNIELIWHLCEIIFLDVVPGDVVLSQLITWIRFHVPQVEKDALKLLQQGPVDVNYTPNYWIVVINCLLQRKIDTVRALLQLSPESETEAFKLVDIILRTMPIFEIYGGLTVTEFHYRHECWKKEAKRLLIDGNFASHKYLTIIVKIVVGDESMQEIIRNHCETWYQHMVASLLYTEPAVKIFDLAFYAKQSITRYGGEEKIKQLDLILYAIMEIDLFRVIQRIQDWTEKDWLPTHLTNIMYISGKLNTPGPTPNQTGSVLHEGLLLRYGTLMMSHRSLWQVGVDYLDYCPTEGRGRLETLLCRIPNMNDEKALKIIQIARERDLVDVVYSIGKMRGMRSLARGNLGAALAWAMRCQDPVFSSQLADMYLKKYMKEGKFESVDLLQNLGSGILLSDRLAFLGRYCEFCHMQKSGDLKEASALLVYMLVNRVPPKYFWFTLFMDALPLIENGKGYFSSQDIYNLMSCLQELLEDEDHIEEGGMTQNKMLNVRKALAKNLAEILIREGSRNNVDAVIQSMNND